MQLIDLYAIFDVPDNAPKAQLISRHRQLIRTHHPDSGGDHVRMAQINAAWDILGDPLGRTAYDALRQVPDASAIPSTVRAFAARQREPVPAAVRAWDVVVATARESSLKLRAAHYRDAARQGVDLGDAGPTKPSSPPQEVVVPTFDALIAFDLLSALQSLPTPTLLFIPQATLSGLTTLAQSDAPDVSARAFHLLQDLVAIARSGRCLAHHQVICDIPVDATLPETFQDSLRHLSELGCDRVTVLATDNLTREQIRRSTPGLPPNCFRHPQAWAARAGLELRIAVPKAAVQAAPLVPDSPTWRLMASAGRYLVFMAAAYSAIMTWGGPLGANAPLWWLLPLIAGYWFIGRRTCAVLGCASRRVFVGFPFLSWGPAPDLGAVWLALMFVVIASLLSIAHLSGAL